MALLIVRNNQTIAGTSYHDGDIFDTSTIDAAEVKQLRAEHKLMDAFEYAVAFSRAHALALKIPRARLELVNQMHAALEHASAIREHWLDADVMAREILARYEPQLD